MSRPIEHTYGRMDAENAKRCATMPAGEDGPVWMVNLMAYKKKAVYDGAEAEIGGWKANREIWM